jgi:hypothetical protein
MLQMIEKHDQIANLQQQVQIYSRLLTVSIRKKEYDCNPNIPQTRIRPFRVRISRRRRALSDHMEHVLPTVNLVADVMFKWQLHALQNKVTLPIR